jgi:trehalose/maltose hydrolase-like predicted phosphorylase
VKDHGGARGNTRLGEGPSRGGRAMNGWTVRFAGFDPTQEGRREALCTLGDGYFATRGAAPEASADCGHYPGTYVAGVYNRLTTELAGRTVEHEDLVNLPNWLPLTFRIAGEDWFDLGSVEILTYVQELDLAQGLLTRTVRVQDRGGRRTRIECQRLVHMRWPHLGALQMTVIPETWAGPIEIRSALDGRIANQVSSATATSRASIWSRWRAGLSGSTRSPSRSRRPSRRSGWPRRPGRGSVWTARR